MEDPTAEKIKNIYLGITIISLFAEIIVLITGNGSKAGAGLPLFIMFFAMALYARKTTVLKVVSFTFLVFAFISSSMYYPHLFTHW